MLKGSGKLLGGREVLLAGRGSMLNGSGAVLSPLFADVVCLQDFFSIEPGGLRFSSWNPERRRQQFSLHRR